MQLLSYLKYCSIYTCINIQYSIETDRENLIGSAVIIAAGSVMQQHTIVIINDNIIECTETFDLFISTESQCWLTSSNNATRVSIIDDDGKKYCNCFIIIFTI